MAQKKLFAILVSDGNDSFRELKLLLQGQGIEIGSARTCAELSRLLDQTHPELVFTATRLSDGTWTDILGMADKSAVPTDVIVVGKCKDTGLYLNTMDRGASDFILPPFETDAMAHVVRVAGENVRRQRETQAMKAVA